MNPELEQLNTLRGKSPSEIRLLKKIATGGVSDLWLAKHNSIHFHFVVKYAKSDATDNPYMYGQFEREFEASQAMIRNNIEFCTTYVSAFDVDALGHPYVFIEYFPAHSLETLRPQLNDWPQIRKIMLQVSKLLSTVHANGIIHRDIKPGNIIMNSAGEVRLIDFALATIDGAWHRFHEEGIALGTPLYMSPEQAFGKKIMLTSACDWYSIGVMMFEWMTGTLPFVGKTPADTLKMHCFDDPPIPINRIIKDAPKALPEMCHALLVKEPNARFSAIKRFKAFLAEN